MKRPSIYVRAFPLLSAIAGLCAAFAHPPWGVLPGLLGYSVLLWSLDRADQVRPLRSAFFRGWLAGCGYFLVSLIWLSEPFQIDAANQGWMAPIAVAIMVAAMALFWGAAALVYRALRATGIVRLFFFAGIFSLFEWLRGHVLTGFPWDLPGETWVAGSAMSQTAAFVGIYGLTWITLALSGALAMVGKGVRGRITGVGAVVAGLGLYALGTARLSQTPAADQRRPWVRLVQANVGQSAKYDPALFAQIVRRYTALTAQPAAHLPDVIIWPEGAIPAAADEYLAPGTWTRAAIVGALKPGQTLLTGAYRYGPPTQGKAIYYTSLLALRRTPSDLITLGLYDKFRLVPFGEFMPLDDLAAKLGIKQMVHVGDGFTPGPRPRPMRLPGVPPFQPLICYESLYSGFTREGAELSGLRASWIANISNDAWFGVASGPPQLLNQASYRAIEEGLPMVRVTPTGISAIIDAFGRVMPAARLGQGRMGVVDAPLPAALPPTPFNRWGEAGFWLMLAFSLLGARWPSLPRRR